MAEGKTYVSIGGKNDFTSAARRGLDGVMMERGIREGSRA